jgi:hypothetical protein
VIPSAPVLTGGVPSGYGVLSAPELVIGGSELWSGGAGGRMMLLLPPIGLAACGCLPKGARLPPQPRLEMRISSG